MPAISASSKVLVTGGSGFLGSWVIKILLERGFKVRAAVRSENKVPYLRNLFKDHPSGIEFVIVPDITTPGAFDEAVKGVSGIVHSASPLIPDDPAADPSVVITPAVQGTTGILKSAANASGVQRVVLTSSVAALWDSNKKLPYVYTEDIWNETISKIVAKYGKDAPPAAKYAASKMLAEQAAWELMVVGRPSYDLVTMLPAYLWGQIIAESTGNIKGSNRYLLNPLKHGNYNSEKLLEELQMVDVVDAARMHVDSLLLPAAGGQRFACVAKTITTQHIYDILNKNPIEGLLVPKGDPKVLENWSPQVVFSNEKSEEVFGMRYQPVEETVRNAVVHALNIGWTQ